MAKEFSEIASELEKALVAVKVAKTNSDSIAQAASVAFSEYQGAVKGAQVAKAAYDAHINEAMTGFAQVHQ